MADAIIKDIPRMNDAMTIAIAKFLFCETSFQIFSGVIISTTQKAIINKIMPTKEYTTEARTCGQCKKESSSKLVIKYVYL